MAGQIGLDEGGVLQALSKGGGKQTHESFEYNRKGLLVDKTTTELTITTADIVFILILLGALRLATLPADEKAQVLAGPFTGPIIKSMQEDPSATLQMLSPLYALLEKLRK